jgi:hypothetical protein
MNSHNVKTRSDESAAPVIKTADQDVASDLSISEDTDKGSDPYNSTGQHVILKSRIEIED